MNPENLNNWISKQERNLSPSWGNELFIQQTIQQINKDFAPYDYELSFPETLTNPDLKTVLILNIKEILKDIDQKNPSSIPQLLYSIDIPEKIFREILTESDSFFLRLAEVILVREAFKVWLRMNFSA